jgi:hypothetical protein
MWVCYCVFAVRIEWTTAQEEWGNFEGEGEGEGLGGAAITNKYHDGQR